MIHFPRKTGGLFNIDDIGVWSLLFLTLVNADVICTYVV